MRGTGVDIDKITRFDTCTGANENPASDPSSWLDAISCINLRVENTLEIYRLRYAAFCCQFRSTAQDLSPTQVFRLFEPQRSERLLHYCVESTSVSEITAQAKDIVSLGDVRSHLKLPE